MHKDSFSCWDNAYWNVWRSGTLKMASSGQCWAETLLQSSGKRTVRPYVKYRFSVY